MSQLGLPKITEAFQSNSLSQKDYLSYQQLLDAMNTLNGQAFDEQTFQELWDQCKLNSKGQAKLSQFIAYIIKAQDILVEKMKNAEISIAKHETTKRPKTNDYSQQQQFKMKLQQLQDDRESIKLSLKILRKPFLNPKKSHAKEKSFEKQQLPPTPKNQKPKQDNEEHLFDYDSSQTVQTLTKILYWTITLLVLNSLCSYLLNCFVDMTLCIVILLGYCFQSVNRKIVKLNLYLLAFSVAYTFLWLVIYTDKLWYPGKSVQFPSKYSGVIKICIMAIISGQIIKLILCYYYLTILQIEQDQVFSINFNSKTLFMKNDNPLNLLPEKSPLIYALKDSFNRAPPPQPEIHV